MLRVPDDPRPEGDGVVLRPVRCALLWGFLGVAAWGAWAAEGVQGEAPAMTGITEEVTMQRLLPGVSGESPRASDERPAPPFISPLNVEPAGPHLASTGDPVTQAELARLRAVVERAPGTNGSRGSRDAARAAWQLGLAELHGVGGPVAPREAQVWFTRAMRLGEPLAAAGLAWCAIDGCGGPPDLTAARRWIAALRPVDGSRAQYLEWLLETRLAPLQLARGAPSRGQHALPGETLAVDGAALPGRSLLLAAARGGSVQAAIELGLDSAARRHDRDALEQFRAAAPRSSVAASNATILAQRLATLRPITTPSAGGATFALAQRYHRGEGMPANFTEAIRLYRLAQSQGSIPARRMLELVFSRPAPDGGIDIGWMQQLTGVDVTSESPTVNPEGMQPLLRREPTPLSDLLPQRWRPHADRPLR